MISRETPEDILFYAQEAAQKASDDAEASGKYHWYPCGFASIRITPARGPFITYLKSKNIGRKHWKSGYAIPSYEFSRQSPKWEQCMNIKADATSAAVAVLQSFGINAFLETRID
jgi:hypothetical protein